MAATHGINRQKFDIEYDNQAGVHQLQNRFRSLSEGSLQSEIQSVFDEFSEQHATIRLNQIELNLGRIREEELESELPERVRKQLREYLSQVIAELKVNPKSEKGSIVNNTLRKIDLLAYFLHHGVLPWWSNAFGSLNLQSLIRELLQGTATELIALVRKNGASRSFIRRLVITFDDSTIFTLVEKLEPAEAKTILEIGKDIIRIQKENQALKTNQETFRHKVWEFILLYLLNDRGSFFNTKDFVRSLLHQLAGHFNVSFETLISQFYQALLHLKKQVPQTQELSTIIKILYDEEIQGTTEALSPGAPQKQRQITGKEFLKLLVSEDFNIDDLHSNDYRNIFEQLLIQKNKKLHKTLKRKAHKPALRKLFSSLSLNETSKTRLDNLLDIELAYDARKELTQKGLFEYLQTGSLSLKYSGISLSELTLHLKELINEKHADLKSLVIKQGTKPIFRERLLLHLEETLIKQLIVILEPSGAPAIHDFAEKLQQVKETGELTISTSNKDFKKLKWRFILKTLLVDRGTRFNLKSFVKSSLQDLADHLNTPVALFISQVLLQLNSLSDHSDSGDLVSVLSELQSEELTSVKRRKAKQQRSTLRLTKMRWVQFIISRGSLPWWSKEQGLSPVLFQQTLLELSISSPKKLIGILRTELVKDQKRQFTLSLLDEEGKTGLIKLLQPQAFESIILYSSSIKQLDKQTNVTSDKLDIQKWDTIIFTLVKDRGSIFNMKSFIMQTLHRMAHHFNLNFTELFTSFLHLSEISLGNQRSQFKQAVFDLKKDFEQLSEETKEVPDRQPPSTELSDFPQTQEIAWFKNTIQSFKADRSFSGKTKARLLQWFSAHKHLPYSFFIQVFRQEGLTQKTTDLFFRQFSSADKKQLHSILKNPKALWLDISNTPEKIHQELTKLAAAQLKKLISEYGSAKKWNKVQQKELLKWLSQFPTLKQQDFEYLFSKVNLTYDQLLLIIGRKSGSGHNFENLLKSYLKRTNSSSTNPEAAALAGLKKLVKELKRENTWAFIQHYNLFAWLKSNATISPNQLIDVFSNSRLNQEDLHFLFRQLSPAQQLVLLKRLSKSENMFLESYHADLTRILAGIPGIHPSRFKNMIQAYGLSYIITNGLPDKHTYLREVLKMITKEWHISQKELLVVFAEATDTLRDQLESTLLLSFQKISQPIPPNHTQSTKPDKQQPKREITPLPEENTVDNIMDFEMEPEQEIEEEGVFINNAGLVILWPFLITYFERLNLLKDGQFIDKKASILGVYALQYLVSGHEESKEYELYLNKVLCGIKPGTPLEAVALTQEQKDLSDSLLGGVIGNWNNMKETSVEALRETFLSRAGHLSPGEEFWSLKVERKTVDILIETMPWSFAVVQLPWLEKVIHVTW